MQKIQLVIDECGKLAFIWNDGLAPLLDSGDFEIRRASYVEPMNGKWYVDLSLSGGPIMMGFDLRGEALEAEEKWLLERMMRA